MDKNKTRSAVFLACMICGLFLVIFMGSSASQDDSGIHSMAYLHYASGEVKPVTNNTLQSFIANGEEIVGISFGFYATICSDDGTDIYYGDYEVDYRMEFYTDETHRQLMPTYSDTYTNFYKNLRLQRNGYYYWALNVDNMNQGEIDAIFVSRDLADEEFPTDITQYDVLFHSPETFMDLSRIIDAGKYNVYPFYIDLQNEPEFWRDLLGFQSGDCKTVYCKLIANVYDKAGGELVASGDNTVQVDITYDNGGDETSISIYIYSNDNGLNVGDDDNGYPTPPPPPN